MTPFAEYLDAIRKKLAQGIATEETHRGVARRIVTRKAVWLARESCRDDLYQANTRGVCRMSEHNLNVRRMGAQRLSAAFCKFAYLS